MWNTIRQLAITAAGRIQIAAGGAQNDGVGTASFLTDNGDTARPLGVLPYLWGGTTADRIRTPNVFKDINAVAIGSIATIWTPTTGKKFRLMGGVFSVSAAVNILLEDHTAGFFIFRIPVMLVNTPFAFTLGGNGYLALSINNLLKATGSGAANLTGTVYGTEE